MKGMSGTQAGHVISSSLWDMTVSSLIMRRMVSGMRKQPGKIDKSWTQAGHRLTSRSSSPSSSTRDPRSDRSEIFFKLRSPAIASHTSLHSEALERDVMEG